MLSDRDSLLWWMLRIWHERSHTADGAAVSCDMATVNGWHRWPFFPSYSASNIRLCCSRHLPRQMCVCGGERWREGRGGTEGGSCWHLSLLGWARLCDVGALVGCRDRPETDMTGPLTRARLHAGSNTAVQHKQDSCSLCWACSERQLRSFSQRALKAMLESQRW